MMLTWVKNLITELLVFNFNPEKNTVIKKAASPEIIKGVSLDLCVRNYLSIK